MNSNIFPLPFSAHLIFCLIAFAVFLLQFIRVRRIYQLIVAVAVPATLLIYLSESRTWFYAVGIAEAVFLIAAVVSAVLEKKNKPEEAETENKADDSGEAEA
ncbi:MAG: hypothetical protein ACI4I9_02735 [Porcipelethomonas sp.]